MSASGGPAVGERLVAALLPVLLHRIQNTTQLLLGVKSLLEVAPGDLPPARAGDLVAAGEAAHEQGWLLGALGHGLGADLLFGRHEPAGLDAMLRLLRDGARRAGRDLVCRPDCGLRLKARAEPPSEAEVCTAMAALAWTALEQLERGQTLVLELENGPSGVTVRANGGASDALEAAHAGLTRTRPGLALEREGARWTLALPVAWVELAP